MVASRDGAVRPGRHWKRSRWREGRSAGGLGGQEGRAGSATGARAPENTLLHAVVRERLETFLEAARERSSTGRGLPGFVEKSFRRYFDCGILAQGTPSASGLPVAVRGLRPAIETEMIGVHRECGP